MSENVICTNCGTVNSSGSKKCQNCKATIHSKNNKFNKRDPRFWLILFVAIFISYLIGSYVWTLFQEHAGEKDPIAQVVPVEHLKDWHVQQFPSGISLQLPVQMKEAKTALDPELKRMIQKDALFTYVKKNLAISLLEVTYKPEVDSLSIEGALDGSRNELSAMVGTVETQSREIYEKDGILYGSQFCSYKDNRGATFKRKELVSCKDKSMTNFIVCYDAKDKALEDIANKIFYSFKLDTSK
ncbi:MAG: hypothetical protein ACRC9Q_07515 [Bacteroidales bacterium]